jgi:2-phospho-L-lactate guanylyltransferase
MAAWTHEPTYVVKADLRPTVIVPVKPWHLSKSRLEVGAVARRLLARAFTLDVLEVVGASRHVGAVIVVTAEPELPAARMRLDTRFVPDRPSLSRDGLNSAIAIGFRAAAQWRPDSPILVLPADLPALTSHVLDETVDLMSVHDSAFVPDASGDGTTMSWGASPEHLKVAYGRGSALRHSAQGARALLEADVRARLDVDTVGDLALARRLGLGIRTAGALHELTRPATALTR